MAAAVVGGGGWMSDNDLFPLHPFLDQVQGDTGSVPIGESLAFYETYQGHWSAVPSLVSGSAEEWTRMARRLVEKYDRHRMEDCGAIF
mmetsp:Transcript_55743/g.167057  ORF Transcript_55743/g.167057 Transcript_55743/m.167057 type:complete len:88 (+) Transcript_55743:742-1005(+)